MLPRTAVAVALAALGIGTPGAPRAQDAPRADTGRAPGGGEFRTPLLSVFLPGLGQYVRGAPLAGAAFTATAVGGLVLYVTGDTAAVEQDELPRHPEGQQAFMGLSLYSGAGGLSAYDAFRRVLPALQREGKYRFATSHAPTASLLTAPFDPSFLGRWTTWIELAYTGVVALVVLGERKPGIAYEPFRMRDAAFVTGLSLTAGAGEEAIFRGWLLPVLNQNTDRFGLSNGIQAAIFGGLHIPTAGEFAAVITAWAVYEGWLTRRNGWDVRESVFHHFWYDAIVATATMVADERGPALALRFPTIHF